MIYKCGEIFQLNKFQSRVFILELELEKINISTKNQPLYIKVEYFSDVGKSGLNIYDSQDTLLAGSCQEKDIQKIFRFLDLNHIIIYK